METLSLASTVKSEVQEIGINLPISKSAAFESSKTNVAFGVPKGAMTASKTGVLRAWVSETRYETARDHCWSNMIVQRKLCEMEAQNSEIDSVGTTLLQL